MTQKIFLHLIPLKKIIPLHEILAKVPMYRLRYTSL